MIYLLRHTEIARQGKTVGQLDLSLTAEGRQKANELVGLLAEYRPVQIVSSDLQRCSYLARGLQKRLDKIELLETVSWREQSLGRWENYSWDELWKMERDKVSHFLDDYQKACPPQGESLNEMTKRVKEAFASLENDTMVITHLGPIRAVIQAYCDYSWDEAMRITVPYGGLLTFKLKNGEWQYRLEEII